MQVRKIIPSQVENENITTRNKWNSFANLENGSLIFLIFGIVYFTSYGFVILICIDFPVMVLIFSLICLIYQNLILFPKKPECLCWQISAFRQFDSSIYSEQQTEIGKGQKA